MRITAGSSPIFRSSIATVGFALAMLVLCIHISAALFVKADTEAALQAMAQRTPTGRVLLWSLRIYRHYDSEEDITATNVSHEALLYRCRDRANFVLIRNVPISLALLFFLFYRRTAPRSDPADNPRNAGIVINAPNNNKAIVAIYSALAIALVLQAWSLFYVQKHPHVAADAIMARSPIGYVWLYDLRVFRFWDDLSDLTRSGLSRAAVMEACRLRAEVGIRLIGNVAGFAGLIAVGHYVAFKRRS